MWDTDKAVNLADILMGLMHWSDKNKISFKKALDAAKNHHWVEIHGE